MKEDNNLNRWTPPPPEHYLSCGKSKDLPLHDFQLIGQKAGASKAFYCGRAKITDNTTPQAGDRCLLFCPQGKMPVKIHQVDEQGVWLRVVLCRDAA